MKTDDLIGLLATDDRPSSPDDLRRLAMGALLTLPLMVAVVAAWLGIVPVDRWPASATLPKLTYALLLLGIAVMLLHRAGRPGSRLVVPLVLLGGTVLAVQAIGLADMMRLPRADWAAHARGYSAPVCPVAILALSVPALGVTLYAARALAPTNLRLAGAAAGLAAGAMAAVAYTLGCSEGALTFVALWYSLGIVLATALGALVGPRALRW